jgi:hypothetical protein
VRYRKTLENPDLLQKLMYLMFVRTAINPDLVLYQIRGIKPLYPPIAYAIMGKENISKS